MRLPPVNDMSAQPAIYRSIIDDVIANVKVDFEEYGMEDEVLVNLQAKWEAKLLETRVADFARAPGSAEPSDDEDDGQSVSKPSITSSPPGPSGSQGHVFPSSGAGLALPMRMGANGYASSSGSGANGGDDVRVKAEPSDEPMRIRGGASEELQSIKREKSQSQDPMRIRGGASEDLKPYIPELDRKPEPNAAGLLPGDEVIDSDLDDSDDELRDEADGGDDEGEVDIVFCVYDKVQRVKNKWKTIFKDGMIHINGRDYLFSKCNGEFEW